MGLLEYYISLVLERRYAVELKIISRWHVKLHRLMFKSWNKYHGSPLQIEQQLLSRQSQACVHPAYTQIDQAMAAKL